MADYTLTVEIDQHWVANFNAKNMKLCFAAAIESGETNFNVVAYTTSKTTPVCKSKTRDRVDMSA